MSKNRKVRPVRAGKHRPSLESLEVRALLTLPATNISPPSQTFNILTQDFPLQGAYTIPSSLQPGASYTIRQLVGYYDYYYNSTQDWTIDLSSSTYTLSNINANFSGSKWAGRNENQNQVGDLDLFPTSYTGIGKLIFAGPSGSSATITCANVNLSSGGSIPLDRIFHVLSGASLGLQNITVSGGMALDNSSGEGTDAEGGAILVDSGANLSLVGSQIRNNFAIGSTGPNVVGPTSSGRQGAGYNASGGGIYGEAGSNISIDSTSSITNNFSQGGRGGNVSGGSIGHGGQGGSAFGAGIAVAAPTSGSSQLVSNVATQLTIDSGATISNNHINQYTSSGQLFNKGGTGGSDAGGKGGSGGNAYGAGLYMGTGQLNLNGGSGLAPLVFSNNSELPGPGFTTGTSGSNAGASGLANGAGATISPGLVVVTNPTTSGGILQFSNNLVSGVSGQGFYLPTVTTAADTGSTSPNGPWNLRTAVAAVNPLVSSGMNLTLNLPAATLTLTSSSTGTNTGSLAVSNSNSGALVIAGAGPASTIINDANLGLSAFAFSGARVTLTGLQITGANAAGNGGAINSLNSTVVLSNASIHANSVSTSNGEGGGIYQSGGSLSLANTKLTNNKAASGGAVFVDSNSTFSMNGGTASGNSASVYGGVLYAHNSPVTLNGVVFSQNSAGSSGGAVCETAGSLHVKGGSVLQSNSAGTNGGAVLVNGGCQFTMNGGSVLTNTASLSGGGVAASGVSASMNTVNVSGNSGSSSAGSGGGLYQSGGTVVLKSTTIQNNHAYQGAGVAVNGGKIKMVGGSVSNNAAQGNGSGGGLFASSNPLVSLVSLLISGNTAANGYGGGIYQSSGTLNLKNNSKIKSNTATQGGGAYLSGLTATMNGGNVKNNTASVNGGGLLSWNGNLSLTGVSVATNKVASGSSIAGYGGGLYQNNGGALHLNGQTLVLNNSAQYGGGILCDSSAFSANGSTIKGNTAVTAGGGFCSLANSQAMKFTNAHVSSNTVAANAAANGGGLYVSGGTLSASGLDVQNNRIQSANNQTVEGGGLYASNTAVNLTGGSSATTTFNGNTLTGNGSGTGYGGGIFLTNGASLSAQSNLTVTNNTITNTANGVGGGIAFFANTSFSSGYSLTSSGNTANAGGNDYAFAVTDTSDNNNTTNETGASGINYFTGGTGSLRSAISYCQNWLTNNGNNHSMAIVLSPSATYSLTSSYGDGEFSVSVPGGTTLTIISENDTSTAQATINASGNGTRVFYLGNSGSVVLQNMVVTGGRTTNEHSDSNNAAGGGIYLDGPTLTLNNTAVQGNTAVATVAGANGAAGTYHGAPGQAGGNGRSAYGGGIYMNQGTLNLLSNASITGNTAQGSAGGAGGSGGSGRTNGAKLTDCDYTNGGKGGNGGNGGNAYGGGLYQANGTLNTPSSNYNIANNIMTPGAGGGAGGGGQSGENEGIECGWGTQGPGAAGAAGSNGNGSNYYYGSGGQCFSWSGSISAQSIDATRSSVNPNLRRLSGVIFELHSADGRLIATTRSDANGSFGFSVPFNGKGYIQIQPLATFAIAPRGTTVVPGITSSFDSRTLRTPVMQFLDGVAMNQKIVLVMTPLHNVLQTGPNSIQLVNTDKNAVIWTKPLMPQSYHGGFTYATVDLNGDSTRDYVVLPRRGPATPFLVDGLTGAVTRISGTVTPYLTRGFAVERTSLIGKGLGQLVLFPSNDRSGRVSVIDLKSKTVLWKSSGSVRGGMTVSVASSFAGNGISPVDVVLTSKTLDVKTDGHNWQVWLDGITGRTIRVLDLYPRTPQTVHLIDVPASALQHLKQLHSATGASIATSTSSRLPIASKHANVSQAMILRRHLGSN